MKKSRGILKLDLQRFAETPPTEPKEPTPPAPPVNPPTPPATYTQEEVNALMAREKSQGRKAALTELGVDDVEAVKKILADKAAADELAKTEVQKEADARKAAEQKLADEQKSKSDLQMQLEALKAGASPDKLNDLVLLASSKVTEDKKLEDVLKELKTSYPMFFGSETSAKPAGTKAVVRSANTPPANTGADPADTSLAARLLASKGQLKKGNYFKQ